MAAQVLHQGASTAGSALSYTRSPKVSVPELTRANPRESTPPVGAAVTCAPHVVPSDFFN